MDSWIPFFQVLIWPFFILAILSFLIGKKRLQSFLEAITERVKKGVGPIRFPGGFELPEMPKEMRTPEEILKEEVDGSKQKDVKPDLTKAPQSPPQITQKEPPTSDKFKSEILKSQVGDWGFLVLTDWALIDPLVTTTIINRYVLPSRKEEIAKKSISDRIGILSAPEYQMPLDLLNDLKMVSGVIEKQRILQEHYNEETIKLLKDTYFRLERLRQFFLYRLLRGPS